MKKTLLLLMLLVPLVFAAPSPAGAAKGVILNFSDVDIATMVKFISDLTGRNFVMDDRVKGKISVFSPTRLSSDEAFNVFTSVLELKGFTIVPSGKVYKIVPTAAAKQSGMKVTTGTERVPVNDAYAAQVIPLENISSQEALSFLQPMVAKDGFISSFGPGNMILVVDSALNIQKILSIVKIIDTEQRRKPDLIFLQNASAEGTAAMVRDWLGMREKGPKTPLSGAGAGGGAAAASGGAFGPTVIADTRLNALIISGSDKDREDIRNLVSLLDVPSPTTSSKINVYYLENADATELAKVLEGIVKGGTVPASPTGAQPGAQAAPQTALFEGGKIGIMADKATNSLVIMASPNDYQNLSQVIRQLDRRRRQVFVEAVIAEVSLDRLRELGAQTGIAGGGSTQHVAAAGVFDPFNFLGSATPQQAAVVQMLAKFSGTSNISAALNALVSNGTVNVLSTPTILTSDNKEAEIFVGENVPFVGKVDVTGTGLAQQSIERKDTGITLRLTPQISEGEYVKMDIYQEISSVKDSVGQAKDLVTTKRSAKTSVVVRDTETVAIGGLIQDRETEVTNKIWLLGDIPVLGWLFKYKSTKMEKTNLLILLTPRIIRSAEDSAAIAARQRATFDRSLQAQKPATLEQVLEKR